MAEKPEDLNLPNAVISRLAKDALPENVNISKEARTAIGKAASVFVLYATSCANNFTQKQNRKTLTAPDVFEALEEMEFEHFIKPLKESLALFRKEQKGKKEAAAESKRKKSDIASEPEPESKRQKIESEDKEKSKEIKTGEAHEDTENEEKP
ncbi:DNA polymerase epsilon subunit 3-like [Stylophora pistillata]|uniref:DNA polymerase epsilon subunit 3 n=1 Tax=Stylophora pistillata TaxID=50429 RepID=A0A2B4RNX7_STYPI|nr:DNA polymerase epsilon subunit 3-like [Stylophora pistillata]PFX18489.1 DNA polymerase epsilon subunit 3 [Stylophora pistillata]